MSYFLDEQENRCIPKHMEGMTESFESIFCMTEFIYTCIYCCKQSHKNTHAQKKKQITERDLSRRSFCDFFLNNLNRDKGYTETSDTET